MHPAFEHKLAHDGAGAVFGQPDIDVNLARASVGLAHIVDGSTGDIIVREFGKPSRGYDSVSKTRVNINSLASAPARALGSPASCKAAKVTTASVNMRR